MARRTATLSRTKVLAVTIVAKLTVPTSLKHVLLGTQHMLMVNARRLFGVVVAVMTHAKLTRMDTRSLRASLEISILSRISRNTIFATPMGIGIRTLPLVQTLPSTMARVTGVPRMTSSASFNV